MRQAPKNQIGIRAIVMGSFFGLWLLVIGAKVVHVQVFQGDRLSEKASRQYESSVRAEGKRGVIYDRNGREMAVSIDATSIAAYPPMLSDIGEASTALARTLQLDRRALAKKLSIDSSFVWVRRQVTPKESAAVSRLGIRGIGFCTEHKRLYPSRTLAAQVLGFTGIDGNGLEGLEYRYNEELNGNFQRLTVLKDALGRGFSAEEQIAGDTDGSNLVLTIDATIQFVAEEALKEAVDTFCAKSAMAVVLDPGTGAVLAMAHYPFFNPNAFSEFEQWKYRNRAITDAFEPGSTLKIFTAAAAIEKAGMTPNCIFFCENGAYRISGHTIHDTHEYGWLSLQQIVKHSSNIGAVKVLETMGHETLYTSLREFGFGARTQIDWPIETPGFLSPYRQWRGVDASAISFGQGVSVSALQLASAVNVIANGGILMRPYVVQAVVDTAGNDVKRFEPEALRRVVSVDTARTIARIMKTVTTEGGTGENVALDGYSVAGKTGTAQKTSNGGAYAKGLYVSSFVGFVPADDPKATIVVIVDEPRTEHYGGTVAGPAFRKIAEGLLQNMNVPPADMPLKPTLETTDQLTVSREFGVPG